MPRKSIIALCAAVALAACSQTPRERLTETQATAEMAELAALSYLEHQNPDPLTRDAIKAGSATMTAALDAASKAVLAGSDATATTAVAAAEAALSNLQAVLAEHPEIMGGP